jgi:hypothetical protein
VVTVRLAAGSVSIGCTDSAMHTVPAADRAGANGHGALSRSSLRGRGTGLMS